MFFPQINSSVQSWWIKQGWNLLEVLQLRNTLIRPSLELSKALEAPRWGEKQEETSLDTIFFFYTATPSQCRAKGIPCLRTAKKKIKQQREEIKTLCSPRCASVALKQTLFFKKKAAELQISCRVMKRKCSNQQYFRFPSGGTEAPAYEAHINRKKSPGDNREKKKNLHKIKIGSFKQV